MQHDKLRVGVIGCGAVAEIGHLPALRSNPDCTVTALIDKNVERLKELARIYKPEITDTDYRRCLRQIDAAVVALPHSLHAPVTAELLENGVHVLVDKPMAMTAAQCDQMIAAAERAQRLLAVGLMRRFIYAASLAKTLIDGGMLGPVESFDFAEGDIYNWPVTSDFFFKRQTAGGGVLLDTGAHTLDLLLWWLGPVDSYEYFDDCVAAQGVEADCRMELKMSSGAEGVIELSRTRNLRNTAIIRGELADMEVDLRKNWLAVYPKGGPVICKGNFSPRPDVVSKESHEPLNADAEISLSDEALVGSHAIECNAENGRSAGHVFGRKDSGVTLPVEPSTEYTVHLYVKGIKGDFEEVPLIFRVGNQDFQFIKKAIINLTDSWKRCSLTFTTGESDRAVSMAVWKDDSDTPIRWLADGFQIEKGASSGYYGPERPPAVFDSMGPQGPQPILSLFHNQTRDWVEAIRNGREPLVKGAEGKKAVALIEQLYESRKLQTFEWQERRIFS